MNPWPRLFAKPDYWLRTASHPRWSLGSPDPPRPARPGTCALGTPFSCPFTPPAPTSWPSSRLNSVPAFLPAQTHSAATGETFRNRARSQLLAGFTPSDGFAGTVPRLPAAGPSSTDLRVAPSRTPRPLHTARSCCPLCLNLLLSSLLSSPLKGRFRRCLLQEAPLGSHGLCTKSSTALGEARL